MSNTYTKFRALHICASSRTDWGQLLNFVSLNKSKRILHDCVRITHTQVSRYCPFNTQFTAMLYHIPYSNTLCHICNVRLLHNVITIAIELYFEGLRSNVRLKSNVCCWDVFIYLSDFTQLQFPVLGPGDFKQEELNKKAAGRI